MAVQRLLVVLDPPVMNTLKKIASRANVSMSSLGRNLIIKALEIEEDIYWDKIASQREEKFNWKNGLTHERVWKK